MKSLLLVSSLLLLPQYTLAQSVLSPPKLSSSAPRGNPAAPAMSANYGKIPLSFEANRGQSDAQVKFLSHGQGYSLFLTDRAAVLALSKEGSADTRNDNKKKSLKSMTTSVKRQTDVVRMELAGAAKGLAVSGADPLPGTANYFIGNDPAEWHSAVPTYGKVKYAGVYPGVDLVYYGNQQQLEYDFVVAPGADPKQVKVHFAGAEKLKIGADGDLTIAAGHGEIAFAKPVVYQVEKGQRRPVEGSFDVAANGNVGFAIGSYDKSRELVIDPVLSYATYLGKSGTNNPHAVAVDSAGNSYIVGSTTGTAFPVTSGAIQTTNAGKTDAFITKLNSQGTALVYSTYLGGSLIDSANAVAVDAAGEAFVAGSSGSINFPVTSNAFQKVNNSYDPDNTRNLVNNAFVAKLTSNGTGLVYSTYLGGSFGLNYSVGDIAYGIAIDGQGDAYVAGQAGAPDFPVTPGAFQQINNGNLNNDQEGPGNTNAFVTKFNPTGSALIYSTYLGGTGAYSFRSIGDIAFAIAIDQAGDAYVTGQTTSPLDFPITPGAFQVYDRGYPGLFNAFVTKINPQGSALIYSTYLGGSGEEYESGEGDFATAIALDPAGDAYVTGRVLSPDFPTTPDAFQTTRPANVGNPYSAFVTKFNPTGSALIYSTYLGGSTTTGVYSDYDVAAAIALDSAGEAVVTGITYSTDFPLTPDALQTSNAGPYTTFLTKLNAAGSALVYSSYFGSQGSGSDVNKYSQGTGVALDSGGNVYLVGITGSSNLPITKGAFQTINPSASNGFAAKFSFSTIDFSQGFGSAVGPMEFNGSADLDGTYLRLTDGATFEAGSAFYATPVNVQSFSTDFNFKLDLPAADGITFMLQGVGPGALGTYGGGLGYAGIGESVAIKFDLHNNAGEGVNSTGLYLGGAMPTAPAINLTGTGIDLHNRRVFHVHLSYDGTTLTMRLSDPVTKAAFTHSFPVDIPAIVGGATAYVGFTGGTGKETATQEIQDWRFTNP